MHAVAPVEDELGDEEEHDVADEGRERGLLEVEPVGDGSLDDDDGELGGEEERADVVVVAEEDGEDVLVPDAADQEHEGEDKVLGDVLVRKRPRGAA